MKNKKNDKKKFIINDKQKMLIIIVLLFLVFLFPSNVIFNSGFLIFCIWMYASISNKIQKKISIFIYIFVLICLFLSRGYSDNIFRYSYVRECYDGKVVEEINLDNLEYLFKEEKGVKTYQYHILFGKKVTFITIKENKNNKYVFINKKKFNSNVISIKKIGNSKMLIECNNKGKYKKIGYIIDKTGLTFSVYQYNDEIPSFITDKYKK